MILNTRIMQEEDDAEGLIRLNLGFKRLGYDQDIGCISDIRFLAFPISLVFPMAPLVQLVYVKVSVLRISEPSYVHGYTASSHRKLN